MPVRCCGRWWCCEHALRIERVVTKGTFALDGGTWDVDNNIWLIGDDTDVVDAAHEAQPIIDAVAGRNVTGVICTHGHNDHVTVAPELGERLHCPVLLHPWLMFSVRSGSRTPWLPA